MNEIIDTFQIGWLWFINQNLVYPNNIIKSGTRRKVKGGKERKDSVAKMG